MKWFQVTTFLTIPKIRKTVILTNVILNSSYIFVFYLDFVFIELSYNVGKY